MNVQKATYGGLDCIAVDALPDGQSPAALVVFCHGFGAGGRDLVPLAPELCELEPRLAESCRFIFPAAPLAPREFAMYGGRAWWPLDVASLTAAIERGEMRDMRRESPAELPDVRRQMMTLVNEAAAEANLSPAQVVLGGFSQGSMVAVDVALHLPSPPLGVVIYSGTLLCEDEWKARAAERPGLNVFQSHGRHDPILSFTAAEWLREMLIEAGANVEFVAFPGDHSIPPNALERTAECLIKWTMP